MDNQIIVIGVVLLIGLLIFLAVTNKPKNGANILQISGSTAGNLHPLKAMILGKYLFVRASVGNAPQAWFMIDSGSSDCLIGTEYAQRIGLRATGSTTLKAGSTTRTKTATVNQIRIPTRSGPTLTLNNLSVLIYTDRSVIDSIQGGQRIMAQGYGGVLGMPFLLKYGILVDYDRSAILATGGNLSQALGASWKSLDADVVGGSDPQILVSVGVDQEPSGRWLLDTGSDKSVIAMDTAQNLGVAAGPPFSSIRLAADVIRIGHAQLDLGLSQAYRSTARSIKVAVPESQISGIYGKAGDLAADYLSQLGSIGIDAGHGQLLVRQ